MGVKLLCLLSSVWDCPFFVAKTDKTVPLSEHFFPSFIPSSVFEDALLGDKKEANIVIVNACFAPHIVDSAIVGKSQRTARGLTPLTLPLSCKCFLRD